MLFVCLAVSETSFPLEGGKCNTLKQVMAREVGNFTATLSVPPSHKKLIYWINKELKIHVVQDKMKARLDELTKEFQELKSKYDELNNSLASSLISSRGKCRQPFLAFTTTVIIFFRLPRS